MQVTVSSSYRRDEELPLCVYVSEKFTSYRDGIAESARDEVRNLSEFVGELVELLVEKNHLTLDELTTLLHTGDTLQRSSK